MVLSLKVTGFEYSWLLLTLSSVATSAFAFYIRAWGLMTQQLFFTCCNSVGAWTWLILPALQSGSVSIPGFS